MAVVNNDLYIDGINATERYGITLCRGYEKNLIEVPAFKSVVVEQWGVERQADLSNPILKTREKIELQFHIVNTDKAQELYYYLSMGVYHTFVFEGLRYNNRSENDSLCTFLLRWVSSGSVSTFKRLGKVTLTFACDDAVTFTNTFKQENGGNMVLNLSNLTSWLNTTAFWQTGYEMWTDGFGWQELRNYRLYILDGTNDSIKQAANVYPNSTISNLSLKSTYYDAGGGVRFEGKDITLKLFIYYNQGMIDFWHWWSVFWGQVTSSGKKKFRFACLGTFSREIECYYKSSNVKKFERTRTGKIWVEFDVTFACLQWLPSYEIKRLLTAEADNIITESSDNLILE